MNDLKTAILEKPNRFFSWAFAAGKFSLTAGMNTRLMATRDFAAVEDIQLFLLENGLLVDEHSFATIMSIRKNAGRKKRKVNDDENKTDKV